MTGPSYKLQAQENGVQLDPSAHQALASLAAGDAARASQLLGFLGKRWGPVAGDDPTVRVRKCWTPEEPVGVLGRVSHVFDMFGIQVQLHLWQCNVLKDAGETMAIRILWM